MGRDYPTGKGLDARSRPARRLLVAARRFSCCGYDNAKSKDAT